MCQFILGIAECIRICYNAFIYSLFTSAAIQAIILPVSIKQAKPEYFCSVSLMALAQKRLAKEISKFEKAKPEDMTLHTTANFMVLEAIIKGPRDTFWEKNFYRLQLSFPNDYPHRAPHVVFITRIFHPNVYNDGRICLDILSNEWSPIYDIQAILTSIRSLLCDPNPDSPANGQAAELYRNNKEYFQKRNTQQEGKEITYQMPEPQIPPPPQVQEDSNQQPEHGSPPEQQIILD